MLQLQTTKCTPFDDTTYLTTPTSCNSETVKMALVKMPFSEASELAHTFVTRVNIFQLT